MLKTENVEVVPGEYRQISVGSKGAFVEKGRAAIVVLVDSVKPDPSKQGDPVEYGKRYGYELTGSSVVWAKSVRNKSLVGVTGDSEA